MHFLMKHTYILYSDYVYLRINFTLSTWHFSPMYKRCIPTIPQVDYCSYNTRGVRKAGDEHARRGHSGTEGGRTSVTYFAEEGVFFKTSVCPRFCKRRVLFCTNVRSMGVKIPLQSTKYTRLRRRVTPEVTGLPSLLPPLSAAKHAEDYKILS